MVYLDSIDSQSWMMMDRIAQSLAFMDGCSSRHRDFHRVDGRALLGGVAGGDGDENDGADGEFAQREAQLAVLGDFVGGFLAFRFGHGAEAVVVSAAGIVPVGDNRFAAGGAPGLTVRLAGASGVLGSDGLSKPKAYQRSSSSAINWLNSSRSQERRARPALMPFW